MTLLLTFIFGGKLMAQTGMEVRQNLLFDHSANLKYTLVKAPTATEPGKALLAGQCTEKELTSIVVPASVKVAEDTSLAGTSEKYANAYSFTQGYSIVGIGNYAFQGYAALSSVDLSTITLDSIGKYAFQGCTALAEVKFGSKASDDCSIGKYAFGQSGLTSLTLPEGVKIIGINAFDGCGNLATLKMPSTVETIGDYAFQSCGLTGELSLKDCSALKSLESSCFIWCRSITSVVLPAHKFDLGGSCFYECDKLSTAENVPCLPDHCFTRCTELQRVSVSSEAEIKTIGSRCFSGCANLESVSDVTSVDTLGDGCFWGCAKLTSLDFLGDKLKVIESYCFRNCTGITSYDIPATVETLGGLCFGGCTNLATLKFLGNNVKAMGSSCFSGTSVANDIVLPSSLETLGDGKSQGGGEVFRYDGNNAECKDVTIPASVSHIGTLYLTTKEASFRFLGMTPPALLEKAKVSDKWTFTVPEGAVDAYKAAFPTVTVNAISSYDYKFRLSNADEWNINRFGTICLPRQADYAAHIAKLYTVVGISSDNKVQIREVEDGVIRAGVPYIYKTDFTGQEVCIVCSGIPVSEPDNSGLLKSTFEKGSYVPVGAYVLQSANDNLFHIVKIPTFTFVPYRAYLQLPEEMAAYALAFDFDEATGIESVTTGKRNTDDAVYDLSGRRVQQPRSGLYIKNGKKYIIK